MVKKKDIEMTVRTTTQVVQLAETKAETKPAVPEKAEAKAEAAVPARTGAAPVEREAKTAPVGKMTVRKTVSKIAAKEAAAPEGIMKKEAAPKVEAKKETASEATKKETVKKTLARKAAGPRADAHSQFDSKDSVVRDVPGQAVKAFKKAHRGVEIRTTDLYIVTNGGAACYVVNSEGGDGYKIIL